MNRVALYARYSSDNQRDASVEDQFRICREHADRQGWTVVECYSDRAVSGASFDAARYPRSHARGAAAPVRHRFSGGA